MIIHVWMFIASTLMTACVALPQTQRYDEAPGPAPTRIGILPFKSQAVIQPALLGSFQHTLVKELRARGQFQSVIAVQSQNDQSQEAYVQCTITQFDSAARRVVVVTEVLNAREQKLGPRLVTRTDLASVIWPFDYFVGLGPLWRATIEDLATSLATPSP